MDIFYIYGLVDQERPDEIRYVGQTHSLLKRFKQHSFRCLWDRCSPPSIWKRALAAFGRQFDIVLIEVVYGDRDDAKRREQFHIDRLAKATGRILNGSAYRKTQRSKSVPKCVHETYLDLFAMMLEDWENGKGAGSEDGSSRAAAMVDRLEKHYPSLAILGRFSSYSWAFQAEEDFYSRELLTA